MKSNLTLKELVKRPVKVQNKKGYCKFDSVQSNLLKSLRFIDNHFDCDISNENAIDFLDKTFAGMKDNADTLFSTAEGLNLSGLVNYILFFKSEHKKIGVLDEKLAMMLMNTDLPKSINIKTFFANELLLLLPNSIDLGLSNYILFTHTPDFGVFGSINSMHPRALFTDYNRSHSLDGLEDGLDKKSINFARLFFNFVLWQQSVHDKGQEVIEIDAPTRKMGFGKNSKQLIVPRVIGEGYKPKVIRNYDSVGTHASPQTHWRSGHWRQQPFGKKEDQKYKTIWIEPTLINA